MEPKDLRPGDSLDPEVLQVKDIANFLLEGAERNVLEQANPFFIKAFQLSEFSTPVQEWKDCDCGGIILYSDYVLNGIDVCSGYTYVISIEELKKRKIQSEKGQIHGQVFISLFGQEYDQETHGKLYIEGFGRRKGEPWKFNSLTFNYKAFENKKKDKEMSFLLELSLFQMLDQWENHGADRNFKNPLYSLGQQAQINRTYQRGAKLLRVFSALGIINKQKIRDDLQSLQGNETKDFFQKLIEFKMQEENNEAIKKLQPQENNLDLTIPENIKEKKVKFKVAENQSNSRFKALFKVVNFRKGMQDPPNTYVKYTEICTIKSNHKIINAFYRNVKEKSLKTSVWGHKEHYNITITKYDYYVEFLVEMNHFKDRGNHMCISFEGVIQYDKTDKRYEETKKEYIQQIFTEAKYDEGQLTLTDEQTGYQVKVNTWELYDQSLQVDKWKKRNIFGLIVYSFYEKDGLRFVPGHVYVNSDDNIRKEESKDDFIFEKLFVSLFKQIPMNLGTDVIVSAFQRKKNKQWNFTPLDISAQNIVLCCFRKMQQSEVDVLSQALAFFEKSPNNIKYTPNQSVIRQYKNTYEISTGFIDPQTKFSQPQIISDEWGWIMIEWGMKKLSAKDVIIFHDQAIEWDWNWDKNDCMHHKPGIRQKDIDHFFDEYNITEGVVILSIGREGLLNVDASIIDYLRDVKKIEEIYVCRTDEAIKLYKEFVDKDYKVCAFLHTTC